MSILKNKGRRLYIGSTDNLDELVIGIRKAFKVNQALFIESHLALSRKYDTIIYACKVEQKLKNEKCGDYIEQIIEGDFIKMSLHYAGVAQW